MPLYAFEAMDRRGKRIQGALDAADENAMTEALREHGLHPIKVALAPKGARPTDLEAIPKPYRPGDALDLETMKALQDRLMDGDDAAYGEIVELLESALKSLERFPDDLAAKTERGVFQEMLKSLKGLGTPRAVREETFKRQREMEQLRDRARSGDPDALDSLAPFKVGPATLTFPDGSSVRGTLLIEPDSFVAVIFQEDEKKEARILCEAREIRGIEMKKWKRGRVTITSRDEKRWLLTLDPKAIGREEYNRLQGTLFLVKRYLNIATSADIMRDLFDDSFFSYLLKDAWDFLRRYRLLGILSVVWGWLVAVGPMMWLGRSGLPAEAGAMIILALFGLPWTWLYLHGVSIRRWNFRFSHVLMAVIGGGVLTGLLAATAGALVYGVVWGGRELLGLVGAGSG